jgi:hypothetical protein
MGLRAAGDIPEAFLQSGILRTPLGLLVDAIGGGMFELPINLSLL